MSLSFFTISTSSWRDELPNSKLENLAGVASLDKFLRSLACFSFRALGFEGTSSLFEELNRGRVSVDVDRGKLPDLPLFRPEATELPFCEPVVPELVSMDSLVMNGATGGAKSHGVPGRLEGGTGKSYANPREVFGRGDSNNESMDCVRRSVGLDFFFVGDAVVSGLTLSVCEDLTIAAFTEASIPCSLGRRVDGIWRSS